jgi:hypothetical protein
MDLPSTGIFDRYHEIQRERIYVQLLEEAIKGLADLKARKTLSLAQLKTPLSLLSLMALTSPPQAFA